MKKYQWHDTKLQKKSQVYDWLTWGFAAITLALYFMRLESLFLMIPFAGAVVCYVLSWQVRSKDAKLKIKKEV